MYINIWIYIYTYRDTCTRIIYINNHQYCGLGPSQIPTPASQEVVPEANHGIPTFLDQSFLHIYDLEGAYLGQHCLDDEHKA